MDGVSSGRRGRSFIIANDDVVGFAICDDNILCVQLKREKLCLLFLSLRCIEMLQYFSRLRFYGGVTVETSMRVCHHCNMVLLGSGEGENT